jgi:hypothetical protein
MQRCSAIPTTLHCTHGTQLWYPVGLTESDQNQTQGKLQYLYSHSAVGQKKLNRDKRKMQVRTTQIRSLSRRARSSFIFNSAIKSTSSSSVPPQASYLDLYIKSPTQLLVPSLLPTKNAFSHNVSTHSVRRVLSASNSARVSVLFVHSSLLTLVSSPFAQRRNAVGPLWSSYPFLLSHFPAFARDSTAQLTTLSPSHSSHCPSCSTSSAT